jgi:UDP-N-acetylmuramyl pentapeptide phosphotransferase/UDP-N-acetylglucosamine-1-phosphate transferase
MNGNINTQWLLFEIGFLLPVFAAIICAGSLVLLHPLLQRYALARPNARSSHKVPTPQGGGIAVIGATIVVVALAAYWFPELAIDPVQLGWVLAATAALAMVGVTDDIRPLEAPLRLSLQALAVIAVIATLPIELRVLPMLPWWFERALLVVASVWFVNLVNFMDGIDWMTVAEVVPVTAGLVAIGAMGALPGDGMIVALALCGAVIAFAPFNRPVARLFLGDVGSLPIGLLIAWLLILVAGRGHLVAALLLPLYYVADTTITLLRRLTAGEPITQAHRGHFYQRAMDAGVDVYRIVGRVFLVNVVLAVLAAITMLSASRIIQIAALAAGIGVVGVLLWTFARVKR